MSIAEQKVELLKFIVEADAETTGELIEIIKSIDSTSHTYSDAELKRFHATRKKYESTDAKTILMEDAHSYIRSLKQK